MKKFLENKVVTAVIVVFTVLLAGVAIFTAVKLYQLRGEASPAAPQSEPGAQEALVCTDISLSNQTPAVGDDVVITCTGTPETGSHAEFQYSLNNGTFTDISSTTTTTATLRINDVGNYAVRCRWCQTVGDTDNCTTWQTAQSQ